MWIYESLQRVTTHLDDYHGPLKGPNHPNKWLGSPRMAQWEVNPGLNYSISHYYFSCEEKDHAEEGWRPCAAGVNALEGAGQHAEEDAAAHFYPFWSKDGEERKDEWEPSLLFSLRPCRPPTEWLRPMLKGSNADTSSPHRCQSIFQHSKVWDCKKRSWGRSGEINKALK